MNRRSKIAKRYADNAKVKSYSSEKLINMQLHRTDFSITRCAAPTYVKALR